MKVGYIIYKLMEKRSAERKSEKIGKETQAQRDRKREGEVGREYTKKREEGKRK